MNYLPIFYIGCIIVNMRIPEQEIEEHITLHSDSLPSSLILEIWVSLQGERAHSLNLFVHILRDWRFHKQNTKEKLHRLQLHHQP